MERFVDLLAAPLPCCQNVCLMALIATNKTIRELSLHTPLPYPLCLTVWPWALAYGFLLSALLFPLYVRDTVGLSAMSEFTADHIYWCVVFTAPVVVVLHGVLILVSFWNVSIRCKLNYRQVFLLTLSCNHSISSPARVISSPMSLLRRICDGPQMMSINDGRK